MKKIAFFTTTRAEFGIFKPLLNEIKKDNDIKVLLFAGGTHITEKHGKTINEIKRSEFTITQIFDYILNEDSPFALAKSAGIETLELAHIFNNFDFDAVCILGDRYELLPIVQNAILFKKLILHIHGGEKTEGAVDEQIRHMITKSAHLHFASCEEYAENIVKMGEERFRVYNTGALSADNMLHLMQKSHTDLFSELNFDTKLPTIMMTYHPVTLESHITAIQQITNIFSALNRFDFQVIITAPNVDAEHEKIQEIIKKEIIKNKNYHYIKSLGTENFHNLLYYSEFIIGNSSSGIIEAPFYKKPTVNIGIRQDGRIRHKSIIDTDYTVNSIIKGIEKALNKKFLSEIQNMKYKFGNGDTAKKIVSIIKKTTFDNNLLKKKLIFE